jgi:hypothetical protein
MTGSVMLARAWVEEPGRLGVYRASHTTPNHLRYDVAP